MSHVLFHVILEPVASESYRWRSSQCRQLGGIWATCHPIRTHTYTHVTPPNLQKYTSVRVHIWMYVPSQHFSFSTGIWNGQVVLLDLLPFKIRQQNKSKEKKTPRTSYRFRLDRKTGLLSKWCREGTVDLPGNTWKKQNKTKHLCLCFITKRGSKWPQMNLYISKWSSKLDSHFLTFYLFRSFITVIICSDTFLWQSKIIIIKKTLRTLDKLIICCF